VSRRDRIFGIRLGLRGRDIAAISGAVRCRAQCAAVRQAPLQYRVGRPLREPSAFNGLAAPLTSSWTGDVRGRCRSPAGNCSRSAAAVSASSPRPSAVCKDGPASTAALRTGRPGGDLRGAGRPRRQQLRHAHSRGWSRMWSARWSVSPVTGPPSEAAADSRSNSTAIVMPREHVEPGAVRGPPARHRVGLASTCLAVIYDTDPHTLTEALAHWGVLAPRHTPSTPTRSRTVKSGPSPRPSCASWRQPNRNETRPSRNPSKCPAREGNHRQPDEPLAAVN
jgi:hypothetical protein